MRRPEDEANKDSENNLVPVCTIEAAWTSCRLLTSVLLTSTYRQINLGCTQSYLMNRTVMQSEQFPLLC